MAEAQHVDRRPRRPLRVTLVLLGVFLIGLANGWRALGLVRQRSLLLEFGASTDPWLCALISVVWAVVFLGLAFFLWRRRPFTRFVVPLASLLYGLNRLVLPGPCAPATQLKDVLSLEGITSVAWVLLAVVALNVASGRAYFRMAGGIQRR